MTLVGAAVADEPRAQPEERALLVERQLEHAHDLLRVAARREVLVPVLAPLDRRTRQPGEERQDRLLHVQVHLQTEPAADGGDDHAHPCLRKAVQAGEHRPDEEGHLGRRPHGQVARPVGDPAAPLEGRGVCAAEVEALRHDVCGTRERPLDVAVRELDVREVVRTVRFVEQRRSRCQRQLGVDDRVERLVVDLDQLAGVLGGVA